MYDNTTSDLAVKANYSLSHPPSSPSPTSPLTSGHMTSPHTCETDIYPNCSTLSENSQNIQINHFDHDMHNETLPDSETLFDEYQELDFALLDKQYTLADGDYSDCPPEHRPALDELLNEFADRFSTSKLDLEITDLYEAELPTERNLLVNEKCRQLPNHKYQFAMKAIKKLQLAGVVRPSDSSWRSNVVLVPKPTGKNELRENTKAEYLTGKQNTSELYRLCLDFRNLNKILKFPQRTQFTTIDQFLHALKNKVVVSLDISSAFFIIPIKESDRYKTAFWVNHHCFEFNVCVMGLKSSPYHLNKFLEKSFSDATLQEIKRDLTPEEQNTLTKLV